MKNFSLTRNERVKKKRDFEKIYNTANVLFSSDRLIKVHITYAESEAAEIKITVLIAADQCIQGRIGGQVVNIPFDTDVPTTTAALAAEIATICDPVTGLPLYTTQIIGAGDCIVAPNGGLPGLA